MSNLQFFIVMNIVSEWVFTVAKSLVYFDRTVLSEVVLTIREFVRCLLLISKKTFIVQKKRPIECSFIHGKLRIFLSNLVLLNSSAFSYLDIIIKIVQILGSD